MRLIDADLLKGKYICNRAYCGVNKLVEIDSIPTAYDVDKVVERLKQQKNQYLRRSDEIKSKFGENYESQKNYGKACSYDHAIEIVKSGGIE